MPETMDNTLNLIQHHVLEVQNAVQGETIHSRMVRPHYPIAILDCEYQKWVLPQGTYSRAPPSLEVNYVY